jgi:hypothetical protein
MVTIVDYKAFQKENGEKFYSLIIQGGIEAVKSQQTGKTYFTTKTVNVPTTFDAPTCQSLIGNKIDGCVKKVETDPYEYTVKETGEIIVLTYNYEYVSEEDFIVDNNVVQKELVH